MLKAFPHKTVACTYSTEGSATEQSYQRMLTAWNQVSELLRSKPAGTLIPYATGTLVMAEFDGELVMFDSPDIEPHISNGSFNLFRPEDFDGIDELVFDEIHAGLVSILSAEPECVTMDPAYVALGIMENYRAESEPNWVWDGVAEGTAA